jgi:hypothetical protein
MRPELLDALSFAVRVLRTAGTGDATNFRKATRFDLLIRANGTEAEILALSREILLELPRLGTRYCAVREIIRILRRGEEVDLSSVPEALRAAVREVMVREDLTLVEAVREVNIARITAQYVNNARMG